MPHAEVVCCIKFFYFGIINRSFVEDFIKTFEEEDFIED